MNNEHTTINMYACLDEGGCADVGVIRLDGFTLIGNDQLEALKDKAAKFDMIRSEMEVGAVQTSLPLYRVAHWHGFEEVRGYNDIDEALNAAMTKWRIS